ncbi:MAG: DNA repair protein RecO [Eubacterium sp.]|nr:DNA repair protein RecO [Eubacterium sp.]
MVDSISVKGIVLDTSLLKEYDKRLVILTAELGRITVFANGARKKNSPLTAVSQKFVMGTFKLHPSRTTYTLLGADIDETFIELSYDIEKMAYASYACELAGYFTQDGIGAKDELNLLYVTFKAILAQRQSLGLIKTIFECKLLDVEGLGLEMTQCVKTGVETDLHHISLSDGGLVNDAAASKVKSAFSISDDAVYALRFILSRGIAAVYSFDISIETYKEIEKIITKYLEIHVDRHFKSLDILKGVFF